MMNALRSLVAFWLAPMPAERLAGVRIACGAYALWYLVPRQDMFHKIWRTDLAMFDPVGLAAILPATVPPTMMDAVYWLTLLAGVLFTIGLGHRVAGPTFGLLLLFMLCYRNSWSMIYHMHNALALHAVVLGITASADAWSVDALIGRRRGHDRPAESWRYGWPIMLVGAITIGPYLLAGIAKLAGPEGLAWASGESLRSQVAVNAIRYDVLYGSSQSALRMLYQHGWAFWLFGIGTFVLELGAPLALANRRLGRYWAIATWGMHWGIFFIMGIKFRHHLSGTAFASFFDLEKLPTILGHPLRRLALKPNLSEVTVRKTTG